MAIKRSGHSKWALRKVSFKQRAFNVSDSVHDFDLYAGQGAIIALIARCQLYAMRPSRALTA